MVYVEIKHIPWFWEDRKGKVRVHFIKLQVFLASSFHSNFFFLWLFFSYLKLQQSVAILLNSNCLTGILFQLKNNTVTNSQVALISQTHWFTTVLFIFSSKSLSLQEAECSRVDSKEKKDGSLGPMIRGLTATYWSRYLQMNYDKCIISYLRIFNTCLLDPT